MRRCRRKKRSIACRGGCPRIQLAQDASRAHGRQTGSTGCRAEDAFRYLPGFREQVQKSTEGSYMQENELWTTNCGRCHTKRLFETSLIDIDTQALKT
ncbi:hypothetical protein AV530_011804 [Patagioenas fasciata monilis]|uniref:Uncharacterized protein n=1 Tax=Patagioenas fasciata monilis TaxID=372326 RepID=A0A1V4KLV2_PATFA|nr:hypothetical protein AV530_011804 [Patagioenas fasciata monilis]